MSGSELPEGWRWVKVGEVADINPRRPALRRADDALTSFVPMEAVDEAVGTAVSRLRPYGEVRRGYTYFETGDVLFAKITPCMENGKQAVAKDLVDGFGFGTTEFHVVRPGPDVTATWLHRFLRQSRIRAAAVNAFTGAVGQQRVPPGFLSELALPLPPLTEQQRIADAIDATMTEAEAAARAVEVQQEAVRQVRLAAFISLLENEGESELVPLLDLCLGKGQYGLSLKASSHPPGLPMLRMGNIQRGRLDWSDLVFVSVKDETAAAYRIRPGDILFNRTNSAELVGKTALVGKTRDALFASYLVRFQADLTRADPRYLVEVINSPIGRSYVERNMGRAIGQVNISAGKMHEFPVPCPPIARQRAIMDRLDAVDDAVRSAETALIKQTAALDALRSAILTTAFQGQL